MDKNNFSWLIEAPGSYYLCTRQLGGMWEFYWSKSHDKAIRFYDEIQADSVMMSVRCLKKDLFAFDSLLEAAKPTTHIWIDLR